MEIKFYNTSSEKNCMNKQISGGYTLQGSFRGECSVSDPVFIIESDSNFTGYNYVYIPEFSRYYYIVNIVSKRTKVWELHLHVDVLMSFKQYLNSSRILLSESEVTAASNYLNSSSWVSEVRRNTTVISFPDGFLNNGEFILITAGGV